MNHIADANKMVGEDVSNEQMTAQATPNEELRRQILSHVVPKNEREWWAARAIERLEFELNAANDRIKRLEEALRRIANQDYRGNRSTESQIAAEALKEAKP